MGSRQELLDATGFLEKHRIVPVVSQLLDGLESAEQGFKALMDGTQMGKIVMKIRHPPSAKSRL